MAKLGEVEDLTGKTFNFLKVIERAPDRVTTSGQKRKFWLCECLLCGNRKEISGQMIKSGRTKSCGCYQAFKGKAERNIKFCAECGKPFECPPSEKTVTCSTECRRIHAKKRQTGVTRSDETRQKISAAAQGRDMTELQIIATEAAKASPKSGRFETNINAKDWHLVSPEGRHYRFRSLNFWLREHCREFFDCEPDSRGYINARSGLCNAKRAVLGKIPEGQRPCCTYKGWRVLPVDADFENDKFE